MNALPENAIDVGIEFDDVEIRVEQWGTLRRVVAVARTVDGSYQRQFRDIQEAGAMARARGRYGLATWWRIGRLPDGR